MRQSDINNLVTKLLGVLADCERKAPVRFILSDKAYEFGDFVFDDELNEFHIVLKPDGKSITESLPKAVLAKSSIRLENGIVINGADLLTVDEAKEVPVHILESSKAWWLRTPGSDDNLVSFVYAFGSVSEQGTSVRNTDLEVRPVLDIDTTDTNLSPGQRFTFGQHVFVIISKSKALCTTSIGCCAFRSGSAITYASDYTNSDVKSFIATWFYGVCDTYESAGTNVMCAF